MATLSGSGAWRGCCGHQADQHLPGERYRRIARRRGTKRAIVAVGRSSTSRAGRQVHAVGFQDPAGPAAAVSQHPKHQVLGAEVAMTQPLGLLPGQIQDPAGTLTPLNHRCYLRKPNRRPAYLWCTACLVTPNRAAICCHDQPLARAFSTWSASST
jgi:hypothetical protein